MIAVSDPSPLILKAPGSLAIFAVIRRASSQMYQEMQSLPPEAADYDDPPRLGRMYAGRGLN